MVGTAGFSYKDWEGTVYPRGLKKREHPLRFLARYFDCCEINTSFYGHIAPAIGRQWVRTAREANPDFRFTAKLHRSLTHSPLATIESTSAATIRPDEKEERLARAGLDSLAAEGALAAVLAQFPVSFQCTPENRAYLAAVIARFAAYRLVVEVRHASWDQPQVLAEFSARGVGFCNIDQPRLGRSLGATAHVTAPLGYVRLHGRNYKDWFESGKRDDRYNYLYSVRELAGWQGHIESIAAATNETIVVTNNHYKGQAAANALELKAMLSGNKVAVPPDLVATYPRLQLIAADQA